MLKLAGSQQNARDYFLYQGNNASCGVNYPPIQWEQGDIPSDYVTLVYI